MEKTDRIRHETSNNDLVWTVPLDTLLDIFRPFQTIGAVTAALKQKTDICHLLLFKRSRDDIYSSLFHSKSPEVAIDSRLISGSGKSFLELHAEYRSGRRMF